MSEELKENHCERPKTTFELFFKWLSDFTMELIKDAWVRRILAATIGLVVGQWALAQNADSISKIMNIFK